MDRKRCRLRERSSRRRYSFSSPLVRNGPHTRLVAPHFLHEIFVSNSYAGEKMKAETHYQIGLQPSADGKVRPSSIQRFRKTSLCQLSPPPHDVIMRTRNRESNINFQNFAYHRVPSLFLPPPVPVSNSAVIPSPCLLRFSDIFTFQFIRQFGHLVS